jgi:rhodanese-related sulfurtransferase
MSQFDGTVGEVTAAEAHEALQNDSDARLVDVRTRAEWTFVGIPMTRGEDTTVLLEWQRYPTMDVDPRFPDELRRACPDKAAPLYFICRSGARSQAAAELAASLGYERCYNVVDGFEGPPDPRGHRGTIAGWKAAGLPWRQS